MRWNWVTLALLIAAAGARADSHPQTHKRGSAERKATASLDPSDIANPDQPEIRPGSSGSGVVRAQVLLDRQHYSSGEIDGDFGTNMGKALAAYQAEHHLPASGSIDAETWASLNTDTAPVLLRYDITDQDEKGPFVTIPKDMLQQATLPALGYSSPLEELAEKFHCSQALMQKLNPGADFTKAGQSLTVPNVLVMPPGQAANVVVSKSESSVRAYDAEGKLLAFYVATIGSEHDPLPIGDWKIMAITRNPEFHYNPNLFWDAKATDTKATIKPGPNNPVGLVWMDLSKEHYGIHGTPDPSLIGHTTSHGCIRLANWDALELAAMVKRGTPALLRE